MLGLVFTGNASDLGTCIVGIEDAVPVAVLRTCRTTVLLGNVAGNTSHRRARIVWIENAVTIGVDIRVRGTGRVGDAQHAAKVGGSDATGETGTGSDAGDHLIDEAPLEARENLEVSGALLNVVEDNAAEDVDT